MARSSGGFILARSLFQQIGHGSVSIFWFNLRREAYFLRGNNKKIQGHDLRSGKITFVFHWCLIISSVVTKQPGTQDFRAVLGNLDCYSSDQGSAIFCTICEQEAEYRNGVYVPLHSKIASRKHPCTPGGTLLPIYYDSGSLDDREFGTAIAARVGHRSCDCLPVCWGGEG